jgi:hypothetical protein
MAELLYTMTNQSMQIIPQTFHSIALLRIIPHEFAFSVIKQHNKIEQSVKHMT